MLTRSIVRLILWSVALASLPLSVAHALPGEVQSFVKISSVTGGLVGPLDDVDNFGISATGLGDLDGDGIVDIAVGVDEDDDGAVNAGAVYILFLNANGTVKAEQKISATQGGFTGVLDPDDRFGTRVEAIGDLDGDGIMDLAVGARRDGDGGFRRGAVWILFLNTDGTVKSDQKISHTEGGTTPTLADFASFSTPTAVGDLDGDGTTELAVGAWGDADSGANSGAVWILFLLSDGTVHHVQKINASEGGFGGTLELGDRFGATVRGVGDLDGDGVPDVAVGADADDDGGTDRGAVWILFLNHNGTVKSEQKISDTQGGFLGSLDNSDFMGLDITRLGDMDGDGVVDIAVGAGGDDDGGSDRGALWVLFLNSNGTVKAHQKISDAFGGFGGALSDGDFFRGVAAIGDLNGDGVTELAGTSLFDDDGGTDRGAAYILFMDGSAPVCGDAVLAPSEECDDGNTADFDGCTATCEIEDKIEFFGLASTAGLLTVDIDGVMLNIGVSSGDNPSTLATVLATLINLTPALSSLGTTAQSAGGAVYSNGRFVSGVFSGLGVSIVVNPGQVVSFQKISDTQGGFTGMLDDGDFLGFSVASLGDLDGDGISDLALGVFADDDGGTDRGALWVLFLNSDGTVKSQQKISDTEGGFMGILDDTDGFGVSATSLGDIDGDGISDLAVGVFGDDDGGTDRGALWILFLNSDGTVKNAQKTSDTQGGFTGILDDDDGFGVSVHSLGDRDGDNISDLAVGVFGDDDGGANRGAVWLLCLNSDGTIKSQQKISDTQGGFTGILDDGDRFGFSVQSIGDLDLDGTDDLAVGARNDSDGGLGRGALWILFLNADGTVKDHQKISDTQGGFKGILGNVDLFGSSLASLGDVDGDGNHDLAVGAQGDDDGGGGSSGALWMLFLNADGTVKTHQKISETQGGLAGTIGGDSGFGYSAESLGDFNGDGNADVATGAIVDDDGGPDRGAVYILSLDSAGPPVCGDLQVRLPETCDDGNTNSGDGCYETCRIEDEVELSGTAQGGTIVADMGGTIILITTSAGQDATTIATNLANAINLTPALQSQGISAVDLANRIVSDGTFDSVTSNDPGIVVPEPGLPLMLVAGFLGLTAARARRTRRWSTSIVS